MNQDLIIKIFQSALAAVDPYQAVRKALLLKENQLIFGDQQYDLDRFERIIVVGAGKATAKMSVAAEETLGNRIQEGLIITPKGQHAAFLRRVEQRTGSHPIPDKSGLEATKKILDMVQSAGEKDLVICLISGGGSALLVQPVPGITLEEKQQVTAVLLKAGASIRELNTVRKHLSRVKGGWLAATAYPATVLTLILSDVIGNPLDVIASGPSAPDSSTFKDAVHILEKYRLRDPLPKAVITWLDQGVGGRHAETPKSSEVCFEKTRNVIIGSIEQALSAALAEAKEQGFSADIITSEMQGEAREAAKILAETAIESKKTVTPGRALLRLSGGETTVTVRGQGLGGRNQEMALAFALEIEGIPGISLLSAGTDGVDGPTDAAGALVDGETAGLARKIGLDPQDYLNRNDSYSFFKKLDAANGKKSHVLTGPTGTNVMDLQIMCIERAK